ncbi:MAG TPA: hypothetical protein VFV43_05140 [Limnobacter sp.]|nr:hypothetical protein [Limnobacter sp.]
MAHRRLNPQQYEHLKVLHHRQLAWRMEQFCAQAGLPRMALPPDDVQQEPCSGDCYTWVCKVLCSQVLGDVSEQAVHEMVAKALLAGSPLRWFSLAHHWFEGLHFELPFQTLDPTPDVLPQVVAMSRQWRVQALPPFDHFDSHQWPVTRMGLQGNAVLHDALSSVVLPTGCLQALVCESDSLGLLPWLDEASLLHTTTTIAQGLPVDPWQISHHPRVATLRWGCFSNEGLRVMHQSDLLDVRQGQYTLDVQNPVLDDTVLLTSVAPCWQDAANTPRVDTHFIKTCLGMQWGWGDVFHKQSAERFCVSLKGELALQAAAWVWHGEWLLDGLRVQFRLRPDTDMCWQIDESVRLSPEQLSAQPALLTWKGHVPLVLTLACPVEVGQPVLVPVDKPAGAVHFTCALVYKPAQKRLAVQLSVDLSDLLLEWSTHSPCGMVRTHRVCWSIAKPLWAVEVDHG